MEAATECVRPKNKVIDAAVAYTLCVCECVCVWCMYLQRLVRNAATATATATKWQSIPQNVSTVLVLLRNSFSH